MSVRAQTKRLSAPLPGGREGATVAVEPLLAGEIQAPATSLERADRLPKLRMLGIGTPRSKWPWVPAPAFLVRHPSVASRPAANMGRLYARFLRTRLAPGEDVPAQLRSRGIEPSEIRLVVMTHLHFDHASAMSEFSGATFLVTEEEWKEATSGSQPVLQGYRRAHYDYAFDYRTVSYAGENVTSYATFGRTIDLFGDGSVRLASTPGHTAGHQSVILRLADRDFVIAGDAIYTLAQLSGAPEPPRPFDAHNWRRSMRELAHFAQQFPQAVIVPGHDREHWQTLEKRYE